MYNGEDGNRDTTEVRDNSQAKYEILRKSGSEVKDSVEIGELRKDSEKESPNEIQLLLSYTIPSNHENRCDFSKRVYNELEVHSITEIEWVTMEHDLFQDKPRPKVDGSEAQPKLMKQLDTQNSRARRYWKRLAHEPKLYTMKTMGSLQK